MLIFNFFRERKIIFGFFPVGFVFLGLGFAVAVSFE